MQNGQEASLSRRERERKQRRQLMVDAAQAVFAEKGYANATLDEIADRAEFGKGTLYNYFENGKEGLLFAVLEELYDEIDDLLRESFNEERIQNEGLRAAYAHFVHTGFSFFDEREELLMILIKEIHRLAFGESEKHMEYFQEQQNRMIDIIVPAVKEAQVSGKIRSLPPKGVAIMLLENLNGMLVHRAFAMNGGEIPEARPDEAASFLTSFLFDGLETS